MYPIDRIAKGNFKQLLVCLPLFLLLPPQEECGNVFRFVTSGPQPCPTILQSPWQVIGNRCRRRWGANIPVRFFQTNPLIGRGCGSFLASFILAFPIPSCFTCKIEGSVRRRRIINAALYGQLRSREQTDGAAGRGETSHPSFSPSSPILNCLHPDSLSHVLNVKMRTHRGEETSWALKSEVHWLT